MSAPVITQQLRRQIIGLAMVVLIVVVVALSSFRSSDVTPTTTVDGASAEVDSGLSSQDFELFDGGQATFADFEGKPLVVNFWASWCPACVAELPEFQAVHEQLGDDVVFLGLANADQKSAAVELAESVGLTYTLADDPRGDLFRSLGLFAMPSTVFISAEGEVIETFGGQLNEQALTDRINSLIGASP